MDTLIINGQCYTSEGFEEKSIFMHNGRIADIEAYDGNSNNVKVIDAAGSYIIPGLVDIHFHGCDGYDFCDGTDEAFSRIAEYELINGVTTIVPAGMTLPWNELESIFCAASYFRYAQEKSWNDDPDSASKEASMLGIHMEGPYVSKEKKGAQNGAYLQLPNSVKFNELQKKTNGFIKLVTMAPELEGGMDFIRGVSGETVISLGHTNADYDIAMQAFDSGANHVTHTYNAMNPFLHRSPGVVGAAFDARAYVELICDGIHVDKTVIRATAAMMGRDRVVLISDSMMGTGLKDGIYQLGGQRVKKKGSLAQLDDGTIAGSVTNLYDCMKNAIRFGISPADAVRFATENPARSIGLDCICGRLEHGCYADVIIADKSFNIEKIFHRGIEVKH